MRDDHVAWTLCGAVEEGGAAAVEAVGPRHAHLGPVGEEHVVLEHRHTKRMWGLGGAAEDGFPGV